MATEKTPATTINKVQTFDISNSGGIIELAKDLAKFIKENKLSSNVQGKDFVNVEGWQYAGARLGIVAVIEYVKDISPADHSEIVYEAKANLLNLSTNQIVGAGLAICSNKENGKKYYQQFAIASMAQTRSVGKAYRNILAWIIRAAGYEPTPSEEMDYSTAVVVETPKVEQPKKAEQPTIIIKSEAADIPPPPPAEESEIKLATKAQKEEIIKLLSHFFISEKERAKMLLNINKIDEERASQSIENLKLVIKDREAQANETAAA